MTPKRYLTRRQNGYYYIGTVQSNGKISWKTTKKKKKSEALEIFSSGESKTTDDRELTLSQFKKLLEERLASVIGAKTMHGYKDTFDVFVKILGDKLISEITIDDIEDFKSVRLKSIKPVTLNGDLRRLKAAFARAVKYKLLSESPLADVESVKDNSNKVVPPYMTEDDFSVFIKVVDNEVLEHVFRFAMYTGCRLSEILQLQWQDIDIEKWEVHISSDEAFETKTGYGRVIPLASRLVDLLKYRYQIRGEHKYLFWKDSVVDQPLLISYVSHNFKRYVRKTDLNEALHFHSLRHSFCSMCCERGIDLLTIKELMGHADLTMIQRIYAHIQTQHKHDEIKKLSRKNVAALLDQPRKKSSPLKLLKRN